MLDVLLTTEGTYPYTRGGVATWAETLVTRMQNVRFHLMAVVANPFVPMRYRLPQSIAGMHSIPLWGTEEPTEHLDLPFSVIYDRKLRTTPQVVRGEFLPLFERLLTQIWRPNPDSQVTAQTILELHRFFQNYDYLNALKSEEVWSLYRTAAIRRAELGLGPQANIRDLLQGLGWLYRFFTVLTSPVPRVDVSHASAAAFSALPALIAKLEHRTPMILTEHGVYLREQYLSIGNSNLTPYGKHFLLSLVSAVTRAIMLGADQVSPVAAYNFRWESRLGVPEKRLKVIYNGVDPVVFQPRPRPADAPLTVVSVARVDPIKDLETLMRAAAIVRQSFPEVKFVVYGSISVETYYQQLLAIRTELGLEEGFIFAGHVSSPAVAYQSGDVIALSSISEGFPYAVVEAMMSGRPVVATDVGGTSEAMGGNGFLVQPRQPEQMAKAIMELLADPALRREIADEARARALSYFTVQRQVDLYYKSYERLAKASDTIDLPAQVEIHLQRATALAYIGDVAGAVAQLDEALRLDPQGPTAPLVLLRLAEAHLEQGRLEEAWIASEKAEALYMLHAA